jgi:hypothetical protein
MTTTPPTYNNGPGNVPRLPDRVVDTLIDSAGVSRCAPGRGLSVIDQSANVERLVHDACEELLARLPEAPPVPPAQAGEALTDEQRTEILQSVLSQYLISRYRRDLEVYIGPDMLRAIIDKAYAAGRQHAPAEPVKISGLLSQEQLHWVQSELHKWVTGADSSQNVLTRIYAVVTNPTHPRHQPCCFDGCQAVADSGLSKDACGHRCKYAAAQPVQGLPDLLPLPWQKPEYGYSYATYIDAEDRSAFDVEQDIKEYAKAYAQHCLAAKGQSQDGLSHRDSGSTAKDAERYRYLLGCWLDIEHPVDGLICEHFPSSDSEQYNEDALGAAIDAAIEAERKQKGGAA